MEFYNVFILLVSTWMKPRSHGQYENYNNNYNNRVSSMMPCDMVAHGNKMLLQLVSFTHAFASVLNFEVYPVISKLLGGHGTGEMNSSICCRRDCFTWINCRCAVLLEHKHVASDASFQLLHFRGKLNNWKWTHKDTSFLSVAVVSLTCQLALVNLAVDLRRLNDRRDGLCVTRTTEAKLFIDN